MVFKASPAPVWPSWVMLGPKLRPVAGAMERFDDWNQRIPHLGVEWPGHRLGKCKSSSANPSHLGSATRIYWVSCFLVNKFEPSYIDIYWCCLNWCKMHQRNIMSRHVKQISPTVCRVQIKTWKLEGFSISIHFWQTTAIQNCTLIFCNIPDHPQLWPLMGNAIDDGLRIVYPSGRNRKGRVDTKWMEQYALCKPLQICVMRLRFRLSFHMFLDAQWSCDLWPNKSKQDPRMNQRSTY